MDITRIRYEKKDGVARVILNRPEALNSVDGQTILELEGAFEDIEYDPEVKAAVLTGAGRAFSTGLDLKYGGSCSVGEWARFIRNFHGVCNGIEDCSKPVIAAINGFCLAGGLELAMACDILIADEKAQISDHHANIGGVPGGGGSQRLPRIVGVKKAKELILTGKWLTGLEAERVGLVNQAAPAGKLEEAVWEMTRHLVDKKQSSQRAIKYLINQGMRADIRTGLRLEARLMIDRYSEMKADVEAFWEKRGQGETSSN
ncbi:enoyl-CoA hydratase/isomerase family protein [Chloroflexota bacterium]